MNTEITMNGYFYGWALETFYVSKTGQTWLVLSPDLDATQGQPLPVEQIDRRCSILGKRAIDAQGLSRFRYLDKQ